MVERLVPRVRAFYANYLPIGDRIGEIFYATWMVVVSLGVLGSTELERGDVTYAILIAVGVNITWGLIDGFSVMYTNIIEGAKNEQLIYDLRSRNDETSRNEALKTFDDSVAGGLSDQDREKVLDMIATSAPGENPAEKRYHPAKEDLFYAIGIFAIDALMVIPLIIPLLIWSDPIQGLYISRLIATVFFAIIGAAYARQLHRRRWLAALFLGTLGFSLFTLTFLAGW